MDNSTQNNSLKRFIEAYESLPELWNKVLPSYKNKYKKQRALEKLLMIYKEIKPGAGIKDVTKKLNILRTNYKRELNKVKSSLRNASGTNEVYKPSSWVYYELQFLQDSDSCDCTGLFPLTSQNVKSEESEGQEENRLTSFLPATNLFSSTAPAITPVITPHPSPVKKQNVKNTITNQNELLKQFSDYLSNSTNNASNATEDDEYLNVAKVWVNKLKSLEPLQRTLAEKAINDVLFEAEMQTLRRDSVKINDPSNPTS